MKRNLYFGIGLYFVYLLLNVSSFQVVEAVLLLSILVFVPFAYSLIHTTKRDGSPLLFHSLIVKFFPVAVICALLAFMWDSTLLALIWWLYGILLALFALAKCLERGWKPLHELAIDSGFMYLALGGFWLFASVAKLDIMGFSETIVLLTAVHFHYSSFLIPIFAGLLGRMVVQNQKLFHIMLVIIIVSPMTVAIGITYSRTIEWFAVLIYLVSLYLYGYFVFKSSFQKKTAKVLVSLSALVLLVTIAFSLIYAYGRLQHTLTISIDTMVWIHGVANAFGVVLLALIGWRIEKSKSPYPYYGKQMSGIYGDKQIGTSFLHKKKWHSDERYSGLVDQMHMFQSSSFDANQLSPVIREFYEHTESFTMKARVQWSGWFKPFAHLYTAISRRTKQIHLGVQTGWQEINGEIKGVCSDKDGRNQVRAWIRKNEREETMFVALYSTSAFGDEVYMNIALPLPFSNMTGILRLQNEGNQLIISSNMGMEAGIYLRFPKCTIALPLSENFLIAATGESELQADHRMKIFGVPFLHIEYQLTKSGEGKEH